MSHFTVLVIGDDPEKQLAPFHEFECTGINDEFVREVDETDEARIEFAGCKETRLKAPDGTLHNYFDDQGNWRLEFSQIDPKASSFDKGRRTYFEPAGYERVEVPASQIESFVDWAAGYYGKDIIPFGQEPDTDDKHKYGYITVDAAGEVSKIIKRTNPDAQWDWYELGGRWTGFFKMKVSTLGVIGRPGIMTSRAELGTADQARKSDIDFDGMRQEAKDKALIAHSAFMAAVGDNEWALTWKECRDKFPGEIESARSFYREQPAYKAIQAARVDTWDCPFESYGRDAAAFVQKKANSVTTTFAVVRDGQWHERGSMGWFGCVADEQDQETWNARFNELIDGLPDDTLLSVYDCHI